MGTPHTNPVQLFSSKLPVVLWRGSHPHQENQLSRRGSAGATHVQPRAS